jgi:hypothetical protein
MTDSRQTVEARVASLPLGPAEREEALAYEHIGEDIADAVLAIMRFFSPPPAQRLGHNH